MILFLHSHFLDFMCIIGSKLINLIHYKNVFKQNMTIIHFIHPSTTPKS